MNKRKIYQAIGITTWILTFLPIFFGWWILTLLLILIYLIMAFKQIPKKIPFMWFFLSPTKRIVHSDLGDFWMYDFLTDAENNNIEIYEQGIFSANSIFSTYIYNDLNFTIGKIKGTLDDMYSKQIEQKRTKKEKEAMLKSWDGYLDPVVRRDEKLNDIGIK